MRQTRGERVQSCLLFVALMMGAVVMTCVTAVWLAYPWAGALTRATNSQPEGLPATSERSQANTTGDRPAPDFTLTDLDGNRVSLSQFRGQPVVINFWATWCPPCRAEIPHLIEAYEQEQGEVVFLAISVDEPAHEVRRFAEEYDMPFIILLDDGGQVADDYRVRGIPVTFFIGRDGEIVVRYEGQMSPRAIREGLRRIR